MARSVEEPVEFEDVVALRETDVALLVNIDGQEVWLPKSQIHDDSEVFDVRSNATGTLVITHWIAKQKGLI